MASTRFLVGFNRTAGACKCTVHEHIFTFVMRVTIVFDGSFVPPCMLCMLYQGNANLCVLHRLNFHQRNGQAISRQKEKRTPNHIRGFAARLRPRCDRCVQGTGVHDSSIVWNRHAASAPIGCWCFELTASVAVHVWLRHSSARCRGSLSGRWCMQGEAEAILKTSRTADPEDDPARYNFHRCELLEQPLMAVSAGPSFPPFCA